MDFTAEELMNLAVSVADSLEKESNRAEEDRLMGRQTLADQRMARVAELRELKVKITEFLRSRMA